MDTITHTSPKDEVLSAACEMADIHQGRIKELESQQRVLFTLLFLSFLFVTLT